MNESPPTPTTGDAATRYGGVGVVISTYNRAGMVAEVIRALQAQDHPCFEVVVVDNGSTDPTYEVLVTLTRDDPRFRVLRIEDNRGPAQARNLGWRSATQPWIAFTDDDCVPDTGWLRALTGATEDGARIVQGTTVPAAESFAQASRFDKSQRIRSWSGRYETCNLLVAREVLEELDGFNEQFRIAMGEDTDLGLRAEDLGVPMTFSRRAEVVHVVWHRGYWGYLRDRWRWADIVSLVRENPRARSTFTLRYFAGEMHVVIYALLPLLAFAAWEGWWLVPVAGVASWCTYRTVGSRHRDQHWLTRFGLGGLELLGIGWEVACFAAASVRYRRMVL